MVDIDSNPFVVIWFAFKKTDNSIETLSNYHYYNFYYVFLDLVKVTVKLNKIDKCIIHFEQVTEEYLVELKNRASWKTLLNAAKIRKFGAVSEIGKNLGESDIPADIIENVVHCLH